MGYCGIHIIPFMKQILYLPLHRIERVDGLADFQRPLIRHLFLVLAWRISKSSGCISKHLKTVNHGIDNVKYGQHNSCAIHET